MRSRFLAHAALILSACGGTDLPGRPHGIVGSSLDVLGSAVADGNASVLALVNLRTPAGSPIAGAGVRFAVSAGPVLSLQPSECTTAANGSCSIEVRSMLAGEFVLTASGGGAELRAPVVFYAGGPDARRSALSASESQATAGAAAIALSLLARDAFGNPVAGAQVHLWADDGATSISPATGTTDGYGAFIAQVRSTVAGRHTLHARMGTAALSATVIFSPGAPDAAATALFADRADVLADGLDATTLRLRLRDDFGNAVPNAAVSFAADDGASVTPPAGSTDESGTLDATFMATRIGMHVVVARAGSLEARASLVALPTPVASRSTLSVAPAGLADGASATGVVATARDSSGQPVAGAAVSLSSSGVTCLLAPAAGVTGADGTFAASLTGVQAGAAQVTADFGSFTLAASTTFAAVLDPQRTSLAAGAAGDAVADGTAFAFIVRAADFSGAPLAGVGVAVALKGAGSAVPSAGMTGVDGRFAFTVASTRAELKTITADLGSFKLQLEQRFVPGPVDASSTLSFDRPSLLADGSDAVSLAVHLQDAHGNDISGATVSLAADDGATVDPGSGITDASGDLVAAFHATRIGAHGVTASAGGLAQEAQIVALQPPAVAAQSSFEVPATAANDGTWSAPVVATARDLLGRPVPGVPVTISSSGSPSFPRPASGLTGADGRFASALAGWAGTSLVTAQFDTFSLSGNITFVQVPSALNSSFGPGSFFGANAGEPFVFAGRDVDVIGNPIVGAPITISVSGSGNTITAADAVTQDFGRFQFTVTTTKSETKTITVNVSGLTFTLQQLFLAGDFDPSHSTISLSKLEAVADGVDYVLVSGVLRDANDNPLAGIYARFNDLLAPDQTLGPDGVFAFRLSRLYSGPVQTRIILDSSQPFHGPWDYPVPAFAFVAGPPSPTRSSFSLAFPGVPAGLTPIVPADGASAATYWLVLADGLANLASGVPVTLSSSDPADVITPAQATTDANGAVTGTISSTSAGAHVITATAGALTLTHGLTFGAVPSASTSTFSISPSPLVADGSTATLVVTVRDFAGNPVAGAPVQLFLPCCSGQLGPLAGTAGADGVFTASFSTLTTRWTPLKFVAETGPLRLSFSEPLLPGPPSASHSRLTSPSTATPSDGVTQAQVLLRVEDAHGNPVPGVTAAISAAAPVLAPAVIQTNQGGTSQALVTSAAAGSFALTATFGSVALTTQVTFRDDIPSAATSSLTLSRSSAPADGHTAVLAILHARDAAGRALPGIPLRWDSSANNELIYGHVLSFDTKTDAEGAARAAVYCLHLPQTLQTWATLLTPWTTVAASLECTPSPWQAFDYGIPGGSVGALLASPSRGEIFAATAGGVARAGTTTAFLQPDPAAGGRFGATCLAADATATNVYACGDGALQISRDAGWSWAPSSALGAAPVALAVDAAAGTVFAATDTGLSRSDDAGATFAALTAAPMAALRGVALDGKGALYAWSGASGLNVSLDGGAGWSGLAAGLPTAAVSAFAADPGDPQHLALALDGAGLWLSADRGATWARAQGLDPGATASALVILPGGTVAIGLPQGVWSSSDFGQTWSQQFGRPVLALAAGPAGDLIIGEALGVFGNSNEYPLYGLQNASVRALVAPGGPNSSGYAALAGGWVLGGAPELSGPPFPGYWSMIDDRVPACDGDVPSLAADPAGGQAVVAVCADGSLEFSTGFSWRPARIGPGVNASSALWLGGSLVALDTVAGNGYATTDSGASWTPFAAAVPQLLSVAATPSALFALSVSGVYRSADGGASWSLQGAAPSGLAPVAFGADGATALYLATAQSLFASSDLGATWAAQSLPATGPLDALAIDPNLAGRLWAAQNGLVFASDDGGASWAARGGGILGRVTSLAVSPASSDSVFAGTAADGVYWTSTGGR